MSGKLFYIGHYLCAAFSPCGTTHATSTANPEASRTSLKGTEHQMVGIFNKIEAYPEMVEGFVKGSTDIGQYADSLCLTGDVGGKQGNELLIALLFGERGTERKTGFQN